MAVNATVGETDSGVVNVEEYETDGTFSQHWVGDVTEIAFDDGLAYICGEVRVLELGTNTNTGLFFRMVVKDNGKPGTDKLDWNRKATEAEASCPYGAGSINKPLIEGNLTVRASD